MVFVTCGSATEATRVAEALVEKRLAACVSMLQTPVKSIYRWKSKVERAKEVLLVAKSSRRNFPALVWEVKKIHSYETPEIIALPIVAGSVEYLRWMEEAM